MALSAQVGSFNTGTAAAGNTVAVSGVGFQPKALIFWWSGCVGAIDVANTAFNIKRGLGVAVSATSRWAVGSLSTNGSAAADTERIHRNDACIATVTTAPAVEGLMDLQSMDADGFTLVVDDAFAADHRIHYLALGGDDLTNVVAGQFNEPAAIGLQSTSGLGFEPDCILFGSMSSSAAAPAVAGNGYIMLAAAVSPTEQAVFAGRSTSLATTMESKTYCRSGECFGSVNTVTPAVDGRAVLSSMDVDGFTLDWLERISTRIIFYLALKGGSFRVGNFNTSVTPGATIAQTGFGFIPKGALLVSAGKDEDVQDVMSAYDQWNMGAFTSTTARVAAGSFDEDGTAASECEAYLEHDQCLAQYTTTGTLTGRVDVDSMDSDGFTLIMDEAASTAAFVWYLAFGDTVLSTKIIALIRDRRLTEVPGEIEFSIEWTLSVHGEVNGTVTLLQDASVSTDVAITAALRTQLAAYVSTVTGQSFDAADVRGLSYG